MEDFYALRFKAILSQFKQEHFSFWMICGYLLVEYVRPQSIMPALDVLPWGKLFIALSIVGLVVDKSCKWVRDPVNKWMLCFQVVIILSCMNAYYPDVAWSHLTDFLIFFIIYFLIVNIVNTEKRFYIFLWIFLLASYKLSFHGAKTWAMRGFAFTDWGLMGPPGFFQNSGELAIQMLMFSPVAYQLAIACRPYLSRAKYWFLLTLPLTGAMTVMGASSRGSQIGLTFQLYLIFLRKRLSLRNILIVCLIGWLGYSFLPAEQKQRFASTGQDRTSQQRILYWTHGLEMIQQYPLLGVGFYNFPAYYESFYRQDMLYPHAELPHNIFVQVGTDAGVLGLFAYLMIIYREFRTLKAIARMSPDNEKLRFLKQIAEGLHAAHWGFLLAGQFVTVTYYPFLWVNLALTVAVKNIAEKLQAEATP